uniref:D,D-carboxypeptidase VanY/endolysin n=1 Tax=Ralstonia pickettii (strain 12D) TaxID=428406 RepID=C6BBQ4_RALP1
MFALIEKVADWLFGDVKRILIVAVLLVIGMAAGVGMVYKHERDTARAQLAQAKADLEKAQADNQALGASLTRQSQAVTDMQKAAVAREAAAAAADKAAQAVQSKYSIAAGRILAQQPGVEACASLHALRVTYTGSQP